MARIVIKCPNCEKEFELDKALEHQLKDDFAKQYENEFEKEKQKIIEEAHKKAQESMSLELKDMQAQIQEKDAKLKKTEEAELSLRKEKRELEEQKEKFELEKARILDEEIGKIKAEALKSISEEHTLKLKEKEMQVEGMKKQIDELKQKAEQGSQQTQGEALELDLEARLRDAFQGDVIEPVPTSYKGADILQKVFNNGQHCGSIIWEAKRTKQWKAEWIEKLKTDQRALGAEVAIIMSTVLPKEIKRFGNLGNVWVTDYSSGIALTHALRHGIIDVSNAKIVSENKTDKMALIYDYLLSPAFKQKIEAVAETFTAMKSDLESEKRSILKIWSKRERQIQKVIDNTISMYGDLEGIVGSSMPQIESLELKALTDGTDE